MDVVGVTNVRALGPNGYIHDIHGIHGACGIFDIRNIYDMSDPPWHPL